MSLKTYAYFISNFKGFGLHVGSPRGVIFIMTLASFWLFIFSNTRPRHAPSRPKTLQEIPKADWRPPQERPSAPQNAPKTSPTRPQEPKTLPRRPQEVLRTAFLVVLDNPNLVESASFINFLHTLPVRTPKNIDFPCWSLKLCLACWRVSFICTIRMHSCRDWGQG